MSAPVREQTQHSSKQKAKTRLLGKKQRQRARNPNGGDYGSFTDPNSGRHHVRADRPMHEYVEEARRRKGHDPNPLGTEIKQFAHAVPAMLWNNAKREFYGVEDEDILQARKMKAQMEDAEQFHRRRENRSTEEASNDLVGLAHDFGKMHEKHDLRKEALEVLANRQQLAKNERMNTRYERNQDMKRRAYENAVQKQEDLLQVNAERKLQTLIEQQPMEQIERAKQINDTQVRQDLKHEQAYNRFLQRLKGELPENRVLPEFEMNINKRLAFERYKRNRNKDELIDQIETGFKSTPKYLEADQVAREKARELKEKKDAIIKDKPFLHPIFLSLAIRGKKYLNSVTRLDQRFKRQIALFKQYRFCNQFIRDEVKEVVQKQNLVHKLLFFHPILLSTSMWSIAPHANQLIPSTTTMDVWLSSNNGELLSFMPSPMDLLLHALFGQQFVSSSLLTPISESDIISASQRQFLQNSSQNQQNTTPARDHISPSNPLNIALFSHQFTHQFTQHSRGLLQSLFAMFPSIIALNEPDAQNRLNYDQSTPQSSPPSAQNATNLSTLLQTQYHHISELISLLSTIHTHILPSLNPNHQSTQSPTNQLFFNTINQPQNQNELLLDNSTFFSHFFRLFQQVNNFISNNGFYDDDELSLIRDLDAFEQQQYQLATFYTSAAEFTKTPSSPSPQLPTTSTTPSSPISEPNAQFLSMLRSQTIQSIAQRDHFLFERVQHFVNARNTNSITNNNSNAQHLARTKIQRDPDHSSKLLLPQDLPTNAFDPLSALSDDLIAAAEQPNMGDLPALLTPAQLNTDASESTPSSPSTQNQNQPSKVALTHYHQFHPQIGQLTKSQALSTTTGTAPTDHAANDSQSSSQVPLVQTVFTNQLHPASVTARQRQFRQRQIVRQQARYATYLQQQRDIQDGLYDSDGYVIQQEGQDDNQPNQDIADAISPSDREQIRVKLLTIDDVYDVNDHELDPYYIQQSTLRNEVLKNFPPQIRSQILPYDPFTITMTSKMPYTVAVDEVSLQLWPASVMPITRDPNIIKSLQPVFTSLFNRIEEMDAAGDDNSTQNDLKTPAQRVVDKFLTKTTQPPSDLLSMVDSVFNSGTNAANLQNKNVFVTFVPVFHHSPSDIQFNDVLYSSDDDLSAAYKNQLNNQHCGGVLRFFHTDQDFHHFSLLTSSSASDILSTYQRMRDAAKGKIAELYNLTNTAVSAQLLSAPPTLNSFFNLYQHTSPLSMIQQHIQTLAKSPQLQSVLSPRYKEANKQVIFSPNSFRSFYSTIIQSNLNLFPTPPVHFSSQLTHQTDADATTSSLSNPRTSSRHRQHIQTALSPTHSNSPYQNSKKNRFFHQILLSRRLSPSQSVIFTHQFFKSYDFCSSNQFFSKTFSSFDQTQQFFATILAEKYHANQLENFLQSAISSAILAQNAQNPQNDRNSANRQNSQQNVITPSPRPFLWIESDKNHTFNRNADQNLYSRDQRAQTSTIAASLAKNRLGLIDLDYSIITNQHHAISLSPQMQLLNDLANSTSFTSQLNTMQSNLTNKRTNNLPNWTKNDQKMLNTITAFQSLVKATSHLRQSVVTITQTPTSQQQQQQQQQQELQKSQQPPIKQLNYGLFKAENKIIENVQKMPYLDTISSKSFMIFQFFADNAAMTPQVAIRNANFNDFDSDLNDQTQSPTDLIHIDPNGTFSPSSATTFDQTSQTDFMAGELVGGPDNDNNLTNSTQTHADRKAMYIVRSQDYSDVNPVTKRPWGEGLQKPSAMTRNETNKTVSNVKKTQNAYLLTPYSQAALINPRSGTHQMDVFVNSVQNMLPAALTPQITQGFDLSTPSQVLNFLHHALNSSKNLSIAQNSQITTFINMAMNFIANVNGPNPTSTHSLSSPTNLTNLIPYNLHTLQNYISSPISTISSLTQSATHALLSQLISQFAPHNHLNPYATPLSGLSSISAFSPHFTPLFNQTLSNFTQLPNFASQVHNHLLTSNTPLNVGSYLPALTHANHSPQITQLPQPHPTPQVQRIEHILSLDNFTTTLSHFFTNLDNQANRNAQATNQITHQPTQSAHVQTTADINNTANDPTPTQIIFKATHHSPTNPQMLLNYVGALLPPLIFSTLLPHSHDLSLYSAIMLSSRQGMPELANDVNDGENYSTLDAANTSTPHTNNTTGLRPQSTHNNEPRTPALDLLPPKKLFTDRFSGIVNDFDHIEPFTHQQHLIQPVSSLLPNIGTIQPVFTPIPPSILSISPQQTQFAPQTAPTSISPSITALLTRYSPSTYKTAITPAPSQTLSPSSIDTLQNARNATFYSKSPQNADFFNNSARNAKTQLFLESSHCYYQGDVSHVDHITTTTQIAIPNHFIVEMAKNHQVAQELSTKHRFLATNHQKLNNLNQIYSEMVDNLTKLVNFGQGNQTQIQPLESAQLGELHHDIASHTNQINQATDKMHRIEASLAKIEKRLEIIRNDEKTQYAPIHQYNIYFSQQFNGDISHSSQHVLSQTTLLLQKHGLFGSENSTTSDQTTPSLMSKKMYTTKGGVVMYEFQFNNIYSTDYYHRVAQNTQAMALIASNTTHADQTDELSFYANSPTQLDISDSLQAFQRDFAALLSLPYSPVLTPMLLSPQNAQNQHSLTANQFRFATFSSVLMSYLTANVQKVQSTAGGGNNPPNSLQRVQRTMAMYPNLLAQLYNVFAAKHDKSNQNQTNLNPTDHFQHLYSQTSFKKASHQQLFYNLFHLTDSVLHTTMFSSETTSTPLTLETTAPHPSTPFSTSSSHSLSYTLSPSALNKLKFTNDINDYQLNPNSNTHSTTSPISSIIPDLPFYSLSFMLNSNSYGFQFVPHTEAVNAASPRSTNSTKSIADLSVFQYNTLYDFNKTTVLGHLDTDKHQAVLQTLSKMNHLESHYQSLQTQLKQHVHSQFLQNQLSQTTFTPIEPNTNPAQTQSLDKLSQLLDQINAASADTISRLNEHAELIDHLGATMKDVEEKALIYLKNQQKLNFSQFSRSITSLHSHMDNIALHLRNQSDISNNLETNAGLLQTSENDDFTSHHSSNIQSLQTWAQEYTSPQNNSQQGNLLLNQTTPNVQNDPQNSNPLSVYNSIFSSPGDSFNSESNGRNNSTEQLHTNNQDKDLPTRLNNYTITRQNVNVFLHKLGLDETNAEEIQIGGLDTEQGLFNVLNNKTHIIAITPTLDQLRTLGDVNADRFGDHATNPTLVAQNQWLLFDSMGLNTNELLHSYHLQLQHNSLERELFDHLQQHQNEIQSQRPITPSPLTSLFTPLFSHYHSNPNQFNDMTNYPQFIDTGRLSHKSVILHQSSQESLDKAAVLRSLTISFHQFMNNIASRAQSERAIDASLDLSTLKQDQSISPSHVSTMNTSNAKLDDKVAEKHLGETDFKTLSLFSKLLEVRSNSFLVSNTYARNPINYNYASLMNKRTKYSISSFLNSKYAAADILTISSSRPSYQPPGGAGMLNQHQQAKVASLPSHTFFHRSTGQLKYKIVNQMDLATNSDANTILENAGVHFLSSSSTSSPTTSSPQPQTTSLHYQYNQTFDTYNKPYQILHSLITPRAALPNYTHTAKSLNQQTRSQNNPQPPSTTLTATSTVRNNAMLSILDRQGQENAQRAVYDRSLTMDLLYREHRRTGLPLSTLTTQLSAKIARVKNWFFTNPLTSSTRSTNPLGQSGNALSNFQNDPLNEPSEFDQSGLLSGQVLNNTFLLQAVVAELIPRSLFTPIIPHTKANKPNGPQRQRGSNQITRTSLPSLTRTTDKYYKDTRKQTRDFVMKLFNAIHFHSTSSPNSHNNQTGYSTLFYGGALDLTALRQGVDTPQGRISPSTNSLSSNTHIHHARLPYVNNQSASAARNTTLSQSLSTLSAAISISKSPSSLSRGSSQTALARSFHTAQRAKQFSHTNRNSTISHGFALLQQCYSTLLTAPQPSSRQQQQQQQQQQSNNNFNIFALELITNALKEMASVYLSHRFVQRYGLQSHTLSIFDFISKYTTRARQFEQQYKDNFQLSNSSQRSQVQNKRVQNSAQTQSSLSQNSQNPQPNASALVPPSSGGGRHGGSGGNNNNNNNNHNNNHNSNPFDPSQNNKDPAQRPLLRNSRSTVRFADAPPAEILPLNHLFPTHQLDHIGRSLLFAEEEHAEETQYR